MTENQHPFEIQSTYIQASQEPKPWRKLDCSQPPWKTAWVFIFFFIWKNWEEFLALTTGPD